MANSRRYERNACFYLWIYRKTSKMPQMQALPIDELLSLPVSERKYKTTLKNIKSYLSELLEVDDTITKVEIERATHVGSFERDQPEEIN